MSGQLPGGESRVAHNLLAVLGWLPVLGGVAVGTVGLIVGINSVGTNSGGIYLLAAVAFGLLANAGRLWRTDFRAAILRRPGRSLRST